MKSSSNVRAFIFFKVDNLIQNIEDKSLLVLAIDFQKVVILIFFFNKNFSENLSILNFILGKTSAEQKKTIFSVLIIYIILIHIERAVPITECKRDKFDKSSKSIHFIKTIFNKSRNPTPFRLLDTKAEYKRKETGGVAS